MTAKFKTIILIILIGVILVTTSLFIPTNDMKLHFLVAFSFVVFAGICTEKYFWHTIPIFVFLLFLKEIIDLYQNGFFSMNDILIGFVGILFGVIVFLIQNYLNMNSFTIVYE